MNTLIGTNKIDHKITYFLYNIYFIVIFLNFNNNNNNKMILHILKQDWKKIEFEINFFFIKKY
jgi:hypothetical protein